MCAGVLALTTRLVSERAALVGRSNATDGGEGGVAQSGISQLPVVSQQQHASAFSASITKGCTCAKASGQTNKRSKTRRFIWEKGRQTAVAGKF
jgi:hypothetical protein